MTVTHVTMLTNAVAPDKLGGLERYVRELSAALVARGVDVTVVTKRMSDDHLLEEVGADGVRIVRYPVPNKRNPLFAGLYPFAVERTVRRATRGRRDVLHAHFVVPAISVMLRRLPYAYTFHAPVYRELLSERQGSYALPKPLQSTAVDLLRRTERAVVSRAEKLILLSEFSRLELGKLSHTAAENAILVPGGIDTDWFCPGGSDMPTSATSDPLLFAARRMTPRTGVLELVQAMPEVLSTAPRAQLVLAGDGRSRGLIENEIERLDLGASVTLLGRIPDTELREWYRKATFTVVPTQELEGFGLSTAESLAVGTPALVTPVGANPEVALPVDAGLVTHGLTPTAIAGGALRLIRDPATLAAARGAARARVHPEYSWSTVVDRHLEIYDELAYEQATAS